MMRSMAIGLAAILLLALASSGVFARGGHGGGGGGGHWGGGGAHWSGGGAHFSGAHWSGGGARWSGARWNGGNWSGRRFAFFHGRRFFHRGPFFAGFAASDFGCWRMWPTAWGWRRVWVCGYPFYGYL